MTDSIGCFAPLDRRPVFSVDGDAYTWADVVQAAQARGTLTELERACEQGLSCLGRLAAEDGEIEPGLLHDAATRFRYDHDLLSAEELQAWLGRWTIDVEGWTGHLSRRLLRERWADDLPQIRAAFPARAEDVGAAILADAVCSGFLEREATLLAGDIAISGVLGPAADRRQFIDRVIATAATARAAAAPDREVEREVAARALDWTRIEGAALELMDADAASEAALCVRVDGRRIADVAADCGVAERRIDVYLEEAEPDLLPALTGARPGELVGPLERAGGFLIFQVQARTQPSPDDPEVRRRAQAVLVGRRVERAMESRVRWHERF